MNKKLIIIFCVIGLIISSYATKTHYSNSKSICDINDKISCSIVSQSDNSVFIGIPVSLIGAFGYVLMGLISFYLIKKKNFFKLINAKSLLLISSIGLLFSFYLTYMEFFKIKVICLLCVTSQLIILSIVILSYREVKKCILKE